MEKFNHGVYRDQLANDLEAVSDPAEKREMLDSEKETLRYKKARELHQADSQEWVERKGKLRRFDALLSEKESAEGPDKELFIRLKEGMAECRYGNPNNLTVVLKSFIAYSKLGVDREYLVAAVDDIKKTIKHGLSSSWEYDSDTRDIKGEEYKEFIQAIVDVSEALKLDPIVEFGLSQELIDNSKKEEGETPFEKNIRSLSDEALLQKESEVNLEYEALTNKGGREDWQIGDARWALALLASEKIRRGMELDISKISPLFQTSSAVAGKELVNDALLKGDEKVAKELIEAMLPKEDYPFAHYPTIINSLAALAISQAKRGEDWRASLEKAKELLEKNSRYPSQRLEQWYERASAYSGNAENHLYAAQADIVSILKQAEG